MKKRFWLLVSLVTVFAMVMAACQPAAAEEPAVAEEVAPEEAPAEEEAVVEDDPCMGAQPGDEITLLYQWSGDEEEKLNTILAPFVEQCGVVLKPESTRDQALLDTKVQAGTPPDVAFWNVAQLEQYKDVLIPMDTLGAHGENYADF
ncbi:MAG: hypothetical protein XD91_0367, partial [Clostridiales bacterium 38_11]